MAKFKEDISPSFSQGLLGASSICNFMVWVPKVLHLKCIVIHACDCLYLFFSKASFNMDKRLF